MKRIISIFLSLCMISMLSLQCFASNDLSTPSQQTDIEPYIGQINGGNIYVSKTTDKVVTIMTNNSLHLIDISIMYPENETVVYEWSITDYPVATFSPANEYFWMGIVEYAELHMSSAKTVTFINNTYDTPIELPQTRSSAGADLLEALEDYEGSEYHGDLLYTTTYQGKTFRVYESMDHGIFIAGTKAWNTPITVASLITGIIGTATTSTLVAAICGAFGIATSAGALLDPGKLNQYTCEANTYRYVTINGSSYVYNTTDKFVTYNGYEDADNNSTNRAYIDSGSRSVNYPDGSTYFVSFTSQVQDAYDMFLNVGQRP